MSNFEGYLLTEGRGKFIKEDVALNWIFKNCQKFISWMGTGDRKSGRFISRSVGRKSDHNFWLVDPKKSSEPRKSANTFNYYTLIMDNETSWSRFPKRSLSLICLTDGYDYGRNEFIIFPKDNWRIGNTNERDFWGVSDRIDSRIATMDDWARMVDILLNWNRGSSRNHYDKNLQMFQKRCAEFDEDVSDMSKHEVLSFIAETLNTEGYSYRDMNYAFAEEYDGDLYKMFKEQITPQRLGCTLEKVGQNLPRETEVWTDSPCIMVLSLWWKNNKGKITGK